VNMVLMQIELAGLAPVPVKDAPPPA
jgi:hypothetical protein